MIKVKLSFPHLDYPIIKLTPASQGIWDKYQFYINQDITDCDYWVVFNHLTKSVESVACPRANTIFITGEPSAIWHYDRAYLAQFASVITCQRGLEHPHIKYYLQGQPWFLGFVSGDREASLACSYDDLSQRAVLAKTKKISLITSSKISTKGHKDRYSFALALKAHFGSALDLYGRGIKDFTDKSLALNDYQYSIAIENSAENDYITEKLYDCFLADCYPIYYGAPNASSYFSSAAYQAIDINDLAGSIKLIESILADDDHYQKHLSAILQAKDHCLHDYNLFALIAKHLDSLTMSSPAVKELITLRQKIFSWEALLYQLRQRINWSINKCSRTVSNLYAKYLKKNLS